MQSSTTSAASPSLQAGNRQVVILPNSKSSFKPKKASCFGIQTAVSPPNSQMASAEPPPSKCHLANGGLTIVIVASTEEFCFFLLGFQLLMTVSTSGKDGDVKRRLEIGA